MAPFSSVRFQVPLDALYRWRYNTHGNEVICLYEIEYYKDRRGNEPVKEYISNLAKQKSKDSRIKVTKIVEYLDALSKAGLTLKEPYIKHLMEEIWELRPLRDRILFVAWDGEKFLLLHHFMKATAKTPRNEIETAKRRLEDAKLQKAEQAEQEARKEKQNEL